MAMERIARRCDGPKSKSLQRLGFACFHHEGLADMRPGFNREPGTMARFRKAWTHFTRHGVAQLKTWRCSTERGVAEFCVAKLRSEGIPFPTHASAEGVEVPV